MSLATCSKPALWTVSLFALAFYVVHCWAHIEHREWHNLLWLSNVATLALAAACLVKSARAAALAFLWLSFSAVLWTLDVAIAHAPLDTAILTHLGSFVLALLAVKNLGLPPGTWYRAAAGLAVLVGISRLVTDARHNVNLAFAIAGGWEERVSSYGAYQGLLVAFSLALFLGMERLAIWRLGRFTAELALHHVQEGPDREEVEDLARAEPRVNPLRRFRDQ